MDDVTARSTFALPTGVLYLAAGAVAGAGTLPDAPGALETVGLALAGGALAAVTDAQVRRPLARAALVIAVLFVLGDRLAEHGVPVDRPWAPTAGVAAYLLWLGMARTPRALTWAFAPALVSVALPLGVRAGGADALLQSLLLAMAASVATMIAVARARAERRSALLAQRQIDLDAVLLLNVELRHVADAGEAARRIASAATDLLAAEGAAVWLQGPGRLLSAGEHGLTPPGRAIALGAQVERVLLSGTVTAGDGETLLPLTGSGGVFGVVAVFRSTRPLDPFVSSTLQMFGAQAGYALERLRAVDGLIDARYVDPVTGVGNQLAATASLATIHPGDAVLLLAADEVLTIRAIEDDARADLALAQLGLHLRTAIRAGDLVARFDDDMFFVLLRDLSAGTEAVVTRILASWGGTAVAGRLRAGAALHLVDTSPLDTLDRAAEALAATRPERVTIDLAAEQATGDRT